VGSEQNIDENIDDVIDESPWPSLYSSSLSVLEQSSALHFSSLFHFFLSLLLSLLLETGPSFTWGLSVHIFLSFVQHRALRNDVVFGMWANQTIESQKSHLTSLKFNLS
jgi:hypothetical protein